MDHFNAKNDIKKLDEVLLGYNDRKDLDLIFTIGTRSTRKAIENISSIPIVFTGVTDPVNAGILSNWKSSGRNLTGIGTPSYITMGIKMLFENLDDPSTLGMIYLEGSPSHEGGIQQVQAFAKEAGFNFVYKGFPLRDTEGKKKSDDEVRKSIRACLEYVLPKVKLFFVQPSQSFSQHFDIFKEEFVKYQTFSAGDPMYIKQGIIMGIGRDIHEFGKQSAQYAIEILNGVPPSDLPMDTGEQFLIEFNLKAAELVNFAPPIMLLAATDIIHKNIETVSDSSDE
nr:ABC transporter substrate binding protein [Desulfamplus magnetovallimortis]